MKVLLQKDVKNLGKVGDLVNVSTGYARNYLFPRQMALTATETKVKEFAHIKKIAEAKKKKAVGERQELIKKIQGLTVVVKATAGENEKLFGAVTNNDLSNELEKMGYSIDRRDIHIEEPIRMLGSHKAAIKLGEGAEAELAISVERA
jgi:large subunit ribosomal protein L9